MTANVDTEAKRFIAIVGIVLGIATFMFMAMASKPDTMSGFLLVFGISLVLSVSYVVFAGPSVRFLYAMRRWAYDEEVKEVETVDFFMVGVFWPITLPLFAVYYLYLGILCRTLD